MHLYSELIYPCHLISQSRESKTRIVRTAYPTLYNINIYIEIDPPIWGVEGAKPDALTCLVDLPDFSVDVLVLLLPSINC